MYLKDDKYDHQTQLRFWSFYYHVLEHLVEKGLNSALKEYPYPNVRYFENWRKLHEKE